MIMASFIKHFAQGCSSKDKQYIENEEIKLEPYSPLRFKPPS